MLYFIRVKTATVTCDPRDRCGYPAPIVDHAQQQRKFKEKYQQQRASAGE